jgi:hypothetical protein
VAQESITKQEMVYKTVRERILVGDYGPGNRVVIDSLARELEIERAARDHRLRTVESFRVWRAEHGGS